MRAEVVATVIMNMDVLPCFLVDMHVCVWLLIVVRRSKYLDTEASNDQDRARKEAIARLKLCCNVKSLGDTRVVSEESASLAVSSDELKQLESLCVRRCISKSVLVTSPFWCLRSDFTCS
jgi:hypothetical protein